MDRQRILLLNVGLRAHKHFQYAPPTTLALLAGLLEHHCAEEVAEVRVVDCGLSCLKVADLVGILDDFRPDVVGLRCFSLNLDLLGRFAALIKDHSPGTVVIVGGPHATLDYTRLLADESIDLAVIGEAEVTICEIVRALAAGDQRYDRIRGLAFRDGEGVKVTPARPFVKDLTEVHSHIDHDLIDYQAYDGLLTDLLSAGPGGRLMTSRGCAYRCAFCHCLSGHKVRRRTVASVMDEIELLMREKGLTRFYIDDDIFNYDQEWAKTIARELIDRRYGIELFFYNGLRADRMDVELVELLYQAGTRHFRFAVETGSRRLQKLIHKSLDLDKAMAAISCADSTPAITDAFFMFGFPGETAEELDQTLAFIEESGIFHSAVSFLQIAPGTEMANIYLEHAPDPTQTVLTSETGRPYHVITDNGFRYSTEHLQRQFREIMRKMMSDPALVARGYEKLRGNLRETEVGIYYGLRYAVPNRTGVSLDTLPDDELGAYLRRLAGLSLPAVMRALGLPDA